MVSNKSALMFTLLTMPSMAKGVKVACFESSCFDYSYECHTWPLRLNDDERYIVLMDPTMSDIQ